MQPVLDVENWKRELSTWRRAKDLAFRDPHQSPLPASAIGRFRGLQYFDPDPAYILRAPIRRESTPVPITVQTSKGTAQQYLRYARATLRFPSGAEEGVSLYYAPHDHHGHAAHEPHQLFLPFRDGNSATITYGAARYLEVENPLADVRAQESVATIDFNFAYNPFCAYSDDYVCPLPPRENWLQAKVNAGERYAPQAYGTL